MHDVSDFKLSPNYPLNDVDKTFGLTQKIRISHDENAKSAMGIVSDTFRKMPDVITGHGLFRVSAWGKDAAYYFYLGCRLSLESIFAKPS